MGCHSSQFPSGQGLEGLLGQACSPGGLRCWVRLGQGYVSPMGVWPGTQAWRGRDTSKPRCLSTNSPGLVLAVERYRHPALRDVSSVGSSAGVTAWAKGLRELESLPLPLALPALASSSEGAAC